MSRSLRWGVVVAAAVAAAALAAASIQRVPPGHVALRRSGVAGEGWTFAAPWNRARVVPSSGTAKLDGLPVRTPEGSTLEFDAEVSYRLSPRIASRLAGDAADAGVDRALAILAGHVVEDQGRRVDAETLLADAGLLETALRGALDSSGVAVDRLSVRSALGAEVLTRKRTAEAEERSRAMPGRRLIVIGWDGADWQIIDPLLASGRMPNLSRFLREGARADLRSYDPMFSPLLWTTVATGKPPTQHGIADFLVKDPATGKRHPITSDFRKVKALWNMCGDLDRESGWVAWWATFPAETIRGTMVTELLASATVRGGTEAALKTKGLASPDAWLAAHTNLLVTPADVRADEVGHLFAATPAEIDDSKRRAPAEHVDPDSKAPPDPLTFVVKLLAAARTYHNVGVDMVKAGLPVVSIYYEAPDMMGHRFQHYLPPKMAMASDAEFERFRNAVPAWYEIQDAMLGDVLNAAGDGANIVLLSDHGFRNGADRPTDVPPYTTGQPAEWHRPWGILAVRGPAFRVGTLPPASLYDITPTLLYLMGMPLAEDMPGRLVTAALRPELLASRPPARIKSYELVGAPMARRAAAEIDPVAMEEMMANLRALGYVGGEPGAGAAPASPAAAGGAPGGAAGETQVFYHRNLAVYQIKQGNLAAAEQELLLANERQPFPKTYAMLGEVRAQQGRFREAAEALEEGFRRIPQMMDADSLLALAEMEIKSGDVAAASVLPQRFAARATPGVAAAIQGRVAEAQGRRDDARRFYEEALGHEPLLVATALRLNDIYRAAGEPRRIVPVLERGLAANPKADVYHHMLGEIALATGDAGAAYSHFKRAVDVQPENGLYLGHLAITAAATGRNAEAREALGWAERWEPREPAAWMAIGSAWDRLGDTGKALEAFERARKAGLEGPAADLGSAVTLARAGRLAEARGILSQARRRWPDSQAVAALAQRLGS